VLALVVAPALAGCASQPSGVPPLSSSVSPSATGSSTIGQYAQTGAAVYASNCAACHGDKGQGVTAPAVIGASAALAKYNTAQGLFSFISTTMPFTGPGSLSRDQYNQILCFILVQNKYADPQAKFDPNGFGQIAIK
jgi:mono/diheme cytochrome c family protein